MTKPKANIFDGKLGTYTPVITEDGSLTLHSEAFDENCHSTAGASSETYYNFIEGCRLNNLVSTDQDFGIFEVGFGTGQGVLTTLEFLETVDYKSKLLFVTTEIDPALATWAMSNQHPLPPRYPSWSDFNESTYNGWPCFKAENVFAEIIILIGDARESIKVLEDQIFSAIYQDAFSPRQNPTLWTKEWFEQVERIMNENALLSTYSASARVRKAMESANLHVHNRPGFKHKRSSTIASKMILDDLEKLKISPKTLPLSDHEILAER